MPRRRIGVALLLPPSLAAEVDGLRRACGDAALGRIPAHITLVPPVNVREERVGDALDVVRAAAHQTAPFTLDIGPAMTFAPVTPVVFLAVGGDLFSLHALRDAVFHEPLARRLTHAFVAHVTLADGIDPARGSAAVAALADYRGRMTCSRVHVLEERAGRTWVPIADATLGRAAVVGRGGLELHLDSSTMLDDEGRALFEREWPIALLDAHGARGLVVREGLVVTARRDGVVVGAATGWTADRVAFVERVVVASTARREGIGSHVLAAFEDAARRRGCASVALDAQAGSDAETFHRQRGYVVEATRRDWVHGNDLVLMRRTL